MNLLVPQRLTRCHEDVVVTLDWPSVRMRIQIPIYRDCGVREIGGKPGYGHDHLGAPPRVLSSLEGFLGVAKTDEGRIMAVTDRVIATPTLPSRHMNQSHPCSDGETSMVNLLQFSPEIELFFLKIKLFKVS